MDFQALGHESTRLVFTLGAGLFRGRISLIALDKIKPGFSMETRK
jgi:hypothetical protein